MIFGDATTGPPTTDGADAAEFQFVAEFGGLGAAVHAQNGFIRFVFDVVRFVVDVEIPRAVFVVDADIDVFGVEDGLIHGGGLAKFSPLARRCFRAVAWINSACASANR